MLIIAMLLWVVLIGARAGDPNEDYWQQHAHYTIEAVLDETTESLHGAATLRYTNASPDDLDRLFFHLHLNAFRPNSVWARNERRRQLDFQNSSEPDFGYERLRTVRVGDAVVEPLYPLAPDSTVVELPLAEDVKSGQSIELYLEWEARPSVLCRRQCRRGRSFDFAQWYPRIAVYDRDGWQPHPLYPQGEFYGEFGTYDVTLDVAADQVIGATGAPVSGDPGWRPAPGSPLREPAYQRDWYGSIDTGDSPGLLDDMPTAGRKRVRFVADSVHHFAWSTSPDYIYEGGRHGDVAIHVLYRPGDEAWADGTAVQRTMKALGWLEGVFGPYPYPQLTNLHRLEGGGTEFPMVVMNGGASQGLIAHESAHQYVHGILANNEWKEAWLDEGMASFLDSWFAEEASPDLWHDARRRAAAVEARGPERPVSSLAEEFSSFNWYSYLAYSRPAFILYMLRSYLGDETFRAVMHRYFERHRMQHVREEDLRTAVSEVSGQNLDWFFDQWFHTTATLDYAVGQVTSGQRSDGRWVTTVQVVRSGDAWMPVTLQVGDVRQTLEAREPIQVVEVITDQSPAFVHLDPDGVLLDSDPSNDRRDL
jgi:hypothetical protein